MMVRSIPAMKLMLNAHLRRKRIGANLNGWIKNTGSIVSKARRLAYPGAIKIMPNRYMVAVSNCNDKSDKALHEKTVISPIC
jgi:hypothetical protein